MFVTIIRVTILYLFVTIAIRIMGKRNIGELQPTELVITLLLSEIVNSLIPVMLLISFEIINSVISMKSIKFRSLSDGNPIIIIKNGELDQKELKKLRLTVDDVLSGLRQKDIFDINEVSYAIIETNGTLSVLLKSSSQNATKSDVKAKNKDDGFTYPVIVDGAIIKKNLAFCGMNKAEIKKELEKKKILKKDVFLMSVDANKNAKIILKE